MSDQIDTLVSYVPSILANRLAANPDHVTAPTAERLRGASLFLDISGFSALTERLAEHGPKGAEELSELLDAYFDPLIEVLAAHGGDIIDFFGDALLAVWPDQIHESEDKAAFRAAQCALALQSKAAEDVPGTGERISVRIGVGLGEMLAANVGGVDDRWQYVVAGNSPTAAAAAAVMAEPGNVVLSSDTASALGNAALTYPISDDYVRLKSLQEAASISPTAKQPGSIDAAAVRAYLPGILRYQLDAGHMKWLAEFRRVTTLFIGVKGLDYTNQHAFKNLQAVTKCIQEAVHRYEGTFIQIGIEDKGTVGMAAFGLPPALHENDARRGVQAASAVHEALVQLGYSSTAGLATGIVFCGPVGNAHRRVFRMYGPVANLAARLMQVADDGTVLCDRATRDAASPRLAFQPLPPFVLKGMASPIPVFRSLQPESAVHGGQSSVTAVEEANAIVGRMAELSTLLLGLDSLQGGQGGTVVIEGEPGIGKSRLIQAFATDCESRDVTCLLGRGDSVEKSTPYHVWRQSMTALFDSSVARRLEDYRQAVLEHLDPDEDLIQLAPLLNALLPIALPEGELTSQMTGEVRADNVNRLVVALIRSIAKRNSTAIVVEDAHWMDSASWKLLRLVRQLVPEVMIVIASRPLGDKAPKEYEEFLADEGTRVLELAYLSAEDTNLLIRRHLGVRAVSASLVNLIYSRSQGNPFFVEEFIGALRDGGLIVVQDGVCSPVEDARNQKDVYLPTTIENVVTSRINLLSPQEQLTAKVASVVGRTFTYSTLRDIHPVHSDRENLLDHLAQLERMDITQLVTPEPNLSYTFKHVITQEVTYNIIPFARRRNLHHVLAEWYEQSYDGAKEPLCALLAHHWRLAEHPVKAIKYLELAAEQALHSDANQEAITFFRDAIALANESDADSDVVRRAKRVRQLGEAHMRIGDMGEARVHFETSLAMLGHTLPSGRFQVGLGFARLIARQALHSVARRHFVGRVPESAQAQIAETVAGLASLTMVYYAKGNLTAYVHAVLSALNLAEALGSTQEMARAYAWVSIIANEIPGIPSGEVYSRRAIREARKPEAQRHIGTVLLSVGNYRMTQAKYEAGREVLEEAVAHYERIGDERGRGGCMHILALLLYASGNLRESAALSEEWNESAKTYNNFQHQAWALNVLARDRMEMGQLDEGIALVKTSLEIQGNRSERFEKLTSQSLLALGLLRQGNVERAVELARLAREDMTKSGGKISLALPLSILAEVFVRAWEAQVNDPTLVVLDHANQSGTLRDLAQEYCALSDKVGQIMPSARQNARLWRGLYCWLDGHPRKARAVWRHRLDRPGEPGMPLYWAAMHFELGRSLPPGHAARARHLETALGAYEKMGAGYHLDRARAILERD